MLTPEQRKALFPSVVEARAILSEQRSSLTVRAAAQRPELEGALARLLFTGKPDWEYREVEDAWKALDTSGALLRNWLASQVEAQ